ncbi:hypothetical protein [Nitrospira sp. BLG_2]|uniref:hypothetical protein n=1 Tax=Nitrospira sp. BLG_2 TaxID=3397507 RepID=UPI003B99EF6A
MTTLEIMTAVKNGTMTEAEAAQRMEAQTAEKVKEVVRKKVSLKVSAKGGIQIDGLRRFPVTLYRSEYEIIDGMRDDIRKFIEANKSRLVTKGEE